MLNTASQSPFQVGGSLPSDAVTYVKRQADEQLYQAVQRGDFCYVFNARQMGKSSLRVQAMGRLSQVGVQCIAIDLTTIGTQHVTPEQWYASFAAMLVAQLQLPIRLGEWWRSHDHLSYVARLAQLIDTVVLAEITAPIVIFIDEVDSVLGLPFATDDFFGLIRYCYNCRADRPIYQRLTFVLLGVTTPTALIQDKQFTPFNIGCAIALNGFQWVEALPLLAGLKTIGESPQTLLQQILYWTNGQPFLTQKLCQLAVQHLGQSPIGDWPQLVQQLVQQYVIDHWEGQDEPEHLRTIRDRLLHDPQRVGQLLACYQRILLSPQGRWPIDNSAEQRELILSGLVQVQAGHLRCKNPIYEAVFNPDWVDRQLAALRVAGLNLNAADLTGTAATTVVAPQPAAAINTVVESAVIPEGRSLVNIKRWFEWWRPTYWRWLVGGCSVVIVGLLIGLMWQRQQLHHARQQQVGADLVAAQAIFERLRSAVPDRDQPALTSQAALFHAKRAYVTSQAQQLPIEPPLELLQQILYQHSQDQRLYTTVQLPQGQIVAAGFQPDGQQIWYLDEAGTIGLWSRQRGHSRLILPPAMADVDLRQIVWPHQSDRQFGIDQQQRLWSWSIDSPQAAIEAARKTAGPVQQLLASDNGTTLAVLTTHGQGQLWRYELGQLTPLTVTLSQLLSLRFFPNNQGFIAAHQAGTLRIYDTNGRLQQTIEPGTQIQAIDISQNGELIVGIGADQQLRFWSRQGELLYRYALPPGQYDHVRLNVDSSLVAIARDDGQILLYDNRGKRLATLPSANKSLHSLAFSWNSMQLLSAAHDRSMHLWEVPIAIRPQRWLPYVEAELKPD